MTKLKSNQKSIKKDNKSREIKGVGRNNNLIPAKKGEIRNHKGRNPLVSSIAHNIREVGKELITISITIIKKKGKKTKERVTTTKEKEINYRMYAMEIAVKDKCRK